MIIKNISNLQNSLKYYNDNLKKDILGAELLKMNYIHIGEKND